MTSRRLAPQSGFLGLGRAAYVQLAIGGLAIAAYGLLGFGPSADVLFIATSGIASAMVFGRVWRTRPVAPGAWLALAVALAVLALANVLTMLSRAFGSELRSIADMLFMGAYLPLATSAVLFARGSHRSDRTVFLDAGIVALAAIPIVWVLVVEPNANGASDSVALMALGLPVFDILLVSLMLPLLLLRQTRSVSAALFATAIAVMGVGDTVYAIASLHGSEGPRGLMNLAWLVSYVLLGAAALVPSAHDLGAARDVSPGSGDRPRLLVIAMALLVPPLMVLHEAWPIGNPDLFLFGALSLVVAMLVALRLQGTINQLAAIDRRFRRFMSHDGFIALIKDGAGRYTYMNPPAERVRSAASGRWYRRTDRDLFPADVARRWSEADAEVRRTAATKVETVGIDSRIWHTERFAIPGTRGDIGVFGLDITDRVAAEEQVRFQARLLASVRDAVIVVDLEGRVTYWNAGAEAILGFTAEEMLGGTMEGMTPTAATGGESVALWNAIQAGTIDSVDWQAIRRDGSIAWLHTRITPFLDEDGALSGYLGVASDVTARKEAEVELARLGAAMGNATDGMLITDDRDRVVYVNPAFQRMTGVEASDVRGRQAAELPVGQPFVRALANARKTGEHWRGDLFGRRVDGSDLVFETTIAPIAAESRGDAGFVTILRDVTHDRAAERTAERRARERALMAETLAGLRAGQTPEATADSVCNQLIKLPEVSVGSIITFGLDGIATVLGQNLRDGVGQPGMVLSPSRSDYLRQRATAGPWVERWVVDPTNPYNTLFVEFAIMANAYAPIVIDGTAIGVLVTGSDQIDAIDVMTERLPALLEFSAITGALLAGAVADRNLAAASLASIRTIIDKQQFAPVFQAIVELATGRALGYEALTRFSDGVPPDIRFEEAHRLGAGLELEAACLRAAFAAAEALPADAWLNLNASPELILAGMVEAALPAGDRKIVLEVTEHQAIKDYASFRAAIDPIRHRVQLAVDDAGAGFASLRHIVELEPRMVKLDRSLIAGIADDQARQAVVAGMVRFAQTAGLELIAEGIETTDELETLLRLEVPLGQGYLLGMPAFIGPAANADVVTSAAAPAPARTARARRPRPALEGARILRA